jgi:hypothetical protein
MILKHRISAFSFLLSFFLLGSNAQAQLLLNEIVVNPPGSDNPFEFIELKGNPGNTLNNIYVCVFEGDSASAGNCDLVFPLNNITLGSNGLLLIATSLGFPNIPTATTFIDTLNFGIPGGILENGNTTFAIIFSPTPIVYNADYDTNNDGTLDLPSGAILQDAVGWNNGDLTALIYGGVVLTQSAGTPDAAVRFFENTTPFSKPAWYNGDLIGSTNFDPLEISSNFPVGGSMTPGDFNTPNAVGIEKAFESNLEIYPNPCSNQFRISGLQNEVSYKVCDLAGRTFIEGLTSDGIVEIPNNLVKGTYFVTMVIKEKSIVKKLMITP